MAAGNKPGIGIAAGGLVFAVSGAALLLTGNNAIGIAMLGLGVVFIAVGLASARRQVNPPQNGANK